jgi:hypothetical protein
LKPDELLKKRLGSRGEKNMAAKKRPSPSQKKSESLRKKLNRGADVKPPVRYDCNRCPKEPCGKTVGECEVPHRSLRCKQCGAMYVFRFDLANIFEYCTPCRLSIEREKNANN